MNKVATIITGLVILSAALYAVAGDSINDAINGGSGAGTGTQTEVVQQADTTPKVVADNTQNNMNVQEVGQETTVTGAESNNADALVGSELYGPDYRFVEITDSPLQTLYGDDISGYQKYIHNGHEFDPNTMTLFDPVEGGNFLFYRDVADETRIEYILDAIGEDSKAKVLALHNGQAPVGMQLDMVDMEGKSPEHDAAIKNNIELLGIDNKYSLANLKLTWGDGYSVDKTFTNFDNSPNDYVHAFVNPDLIETHESKSGYTREFHATGKKLIN